MPQTNKKRMDREMALNALNALKVSALIRFKVETQTFEGRIYRRQFYKNNHTTSKYLNGAELKYHVRVMDDKWPDRCYIITPDQIINPIVFADVIDLTIESDIEIEQEKECYDAIRSDQNNNVIDQEKECCICMNDTIQIAFDPCGHVSCCVKCAEDLDSCPMCRNHITKKIRLFFI